VSDGVAFSPTATATYTVTGTNAATGCTNTAVRTITVAPTPTVTTSTSNSVICIGNSTSLTGIGATTYTWSNGVTNGASFSPTATATYTVIGATGGCTNTAVRTITVNPLPGVSSTASSSAICNGGSVTLNGTGAGTYTWTGGISNGVAFSPTTTTTYTVTGTDANGCVNTSVRTVTVNPIPASTTSTSGTITCVTNTVNLNSTLAGASYTWTAPGGSSVNGGTANNQNAVGQGAGTYTLNVMSAAGCTYSTTLATNINTLAPTASAGNGTLTCAVTSTVLTGGPLSGVTYNWSGPGIVGSNTIANITASVVGTYSLVTTSMVNGCSSAAAAVGTLTSNLTTPTVTAGSNQTITCAAPTVTLAGSATAGSNYSWSNGALTSTTTVSGSGIYTLTAINPSTGCSSTATVQVLPSAGTPTGNIGAASNSITCANTSATVSITSGSSPISITWTGPGITGPTNTASTTVSQGNVTYTVTLTNTTSMCSQAYNVFVPLNTTPVVASASISAGSSSITCSTSSVTLSSSPTGANYSYSWTGPGIVSGGNTANPVVNLGGNYSVTITNTVNGCSGVTGTTNVAVPSNTSSPTLSLSAISVTTTCGNPSATVTASSNSNPNTTYTWTAPATGTISNTSVSNPSIGGTGVFTVAITNTVSGCPSAPMTVTITADANTPTYNLSDNTATITCAVSNPSVSLTSTVSGVTYSWSPAPASGVTVASPTFTAPGNYTCVITNPSNACSTGALVTVTQDLALPTATASASSTITCSTNSLSLTSSVTPTNNVIYNWTGPNILSGSNSLNPVVSSGGNYVISMTNTINGCSNTYTVNVPSNTITPSINLAANAYTTTCSAPGITVSVTSSSDPATTYSWTAPSTGTISNSTSNNPMVGGSGVFTVAVTNTVNGCVSAIETVTITPDQNIPTFSLQANSATISCSIPSPSVSLTSTVSGVTYSWNPVPASGATTASPTFTAPGNYTCTITNPANNCSTNAAQVSVNTNTAIPVATITPGASVTCNSTTVILTASVIPSPVTYTWSGTGITGSVNGMSVTTIAGDYTLTVTDPANGCSVNATTSVGTDTATPTLTVASTSSVITCSITSSTLTAGSLSGTPTWVIPGGNSATNPVTTAVPGDYTVTVIDNNNGCTTSQTVSITGNTIPPNADAGAATVVPCGSSSVTLMGSSTSTDVVTYSWAGPTAGSISGANPNVTSVGVYTLTVTNSSTGCSQTATVSVTQNNVTASFNADPGTGEAPLAVSFTNTSVGAISYIWNFGNGTTSTSQDPNTVFNDAGTYYVILTASNGPCSDTAVRTIVVEDGFSIEIPNVFTPNGDGANELFHIKTSGVKSAEGYIYNRWGQILYSWDVLNISWDGKASNGENCPDGTYYYLIKVIDKKDKEHLAPGFVLIAR
jgi:gliding motility-associated-like protein